MKGGGWGVGVTICLNYVQRRGSPCCNFFNLIIPKCEFHCLKAWILSHSSSVADPDRSNNGNHNHGVAETLWRGWARRNIFDDPSKLALDIWGSEHRPEYSQSPATLSIVLVHDGQEFGRS